MTKQQNSVFTPRTLEGLKLYLQFVKYEALTRAGQRPQQKALEPFKIEVKAHSHFSDKYTLRGFKREYNGRVYFFKPLLIRQMKADGTYIDEQAEQELLNPLSDVFMYQASEPITDDITENFYDFGDANEDLYKI
jgi:hypothetical protein